MSGAGAERSPPPAAKLRRLDPTAEPGAEALSPGGSPEAAGSTESTGEAEGGKEAFAPVSLGRERGRKRGLEEKRGLETPRRGRNGGLESTAGFGGGLESIAGSHFGKGRGGKGGPEDEEGLGSVSPGLLGKGRVGKRGPEGGGGLEGITGSPLGKGRGGKRGLEGVRGVKSSAVGCSEQERRRNGDLESTAGSEGGLEIIAGSPLGKGRGGKTGPEDESGLESVSPGSLGKGRGGKRGREGKESLETAGTGCSEQRRSINGGLESNIEWGRGLETTAEPKGGAGDNVEPNGILESGAVSPSEQSRAGMGGLAPKRGSPEDCAVISLGEDEEEEEEEEEEELEEGPGRYLAALEAVQLELEAVEEEAARAFRRLRAKFGLRRRPHLQRRNRLIQHIPGFWVTAFLNHPQLSAMISDRDEDALSYMTSLQVEEFGVAQPGCRIRFFFAVNPYFQNRVVAKEFVRGPSGHLVSHSTPIRWWQGQDPRCHPQKGPPGPRSFFTWFGDHSFPAGDRVAEIIKEELWPNPLPFYLLGEGAEGPPESESGEDSVVIVDDDEDVQEILDDGDGSGVEEVVAEESKRGRD